jgi:hypothetical protein
MTRLPPHERPSARELAGLGNSKFCPRCGASEWRGELNSSVEYTRHPDGALTTIRRRVCQCGQYAFRTEEIVVPPGHKLQIVPVDEDAA